MAQHNIEKYNIFYALLRWYCNILFHRYYKRIETHGYNENVPKEGSIIFAANHQNALIDALAIISTQRRQLVFLARSDIFENPVSNKILTFFKIPDIITNVLNPIHAILVPLSKIDTKEIKFGNQFFFFVSSSNIEFL